MSQSSATTDQARELGLPTPEDFGNEEQTPQLHRARLERQNVDACHLCGKTAWHDRAGDSFVVQDCKKCQRPTCEECAEMDYDLQGDPPQFVCTQWDCKACTEKSVLEAAIQVHRTEEDRLYNERRALEARLDEIETAEVEAEERNER